MAGSVGSRMDELLDEFTREAEAVGAGVHHAARADVVDTLASLLGGVRSVVVAAGLESLAADLRGPSREILLEGRDTGAAERLPTADAGICEALAGVAASGTVLVGPGTGLEGLASTLPPHSIVVLERAQIHRDIASALAVVSDLVAAPGSRLAFITGPSRTSDIELTPVIGVHGPLRLDLVVIDG